MPMVYIPKELYDELVQHGENVSKFLEEAAKEKLAIIKDPCQSNKAL